MFNFDTHKWLTVKIFIIIVKINVVYLGKGFTCNQLTPANIFAMQFNVECVSLASFLPKKTHVSRPDFYKKKRERERAGGFFCYLLFRFLYTLLPSPRDTLELLSQILIQRNIRYWLNTSLFNFDTHKGLTVKIYIILVCTQQQWALQVTPVGFCS